MHENCLSPEDISTIKEGPTSTEFRFEIGKRIRSFKCVSIPAWLSDQKVQITTEVIDKDLPLLLSKQAMKNAKVSIDFENDTVEILEKEHQIQFSSKGH